MDGRVMEDCCASGGPVGDAATALVVLITGPGCG